MFRFQISDYDAPALEAETAELLSQRREKASRQNFPGLWKLTDHFYAHAAKGPGWESRRKAYHAYGYFLLALGAFAIMLGLMEPGIPALVAAGVFAVACGILEFLLVCRWRPPRVPWMASCREEAKALSDTAKDYLSGLRKQHEDTDFIVTGEGDDEAKLAKASKKEFTVILSGEEVERMATDEDYAKQQLRSMETTWRMNESIMQQNGYTRGYGITGE